MDFVSEGALKEIGKPKLGIKIGTEIAVLAFVDDIVALSQYREVYKKLQKYWLKKLVL